jgi:subtilase family serine protease
MQQVGRFSAWGCYFLGMAFLCTGSGSVHASTRIDLEVDSAQMGPSRRSANERVEITASVRNNGSEPAENVFLMAEIKKDGKRVKAVKDIPVLAHLPRSGSGQSIPIPIGELPAGSYEAVIFVDPDNAISETDENNNEESIRFNIY